MNAYVLLSLFNELGKIDKILSFCNELNKFNYTGARMLYSIYHMALKLLRNRIFGINALLCHFCATLKWTSLRNVTKSVNHLWFIICIAWCYITPWRDLM